MLSVALSSLTTHDQDSRVDVWYSDLPLGEIEFLKFCFPKVNFEEKNRIINGNTHQARASKKIIDWEAFFSSEDVASGETVFFFDADVIFMKKLDPIDFGKFDLSLTTKESKWPLNTGVVVLQKSNKTVKFMTMWLQSIYEIFESKTLEKKAVLNYGGVDQAAIPYVLPELKLIEGPLSQEVNCAGFSLRINLLPCEVFNQTESGAITKDTMIYHLKAGWHPILLESAKYSKTRTELASREIHSIWLNHLASINGKTKDFITSIASSSNLDLSQVCERYEPGGILNSELLAFSEMCRFLNADLIIESGRSRGHSTHFLADVFKGTQTEVISIELQKNSQSDYALGKLRDFPGLSLLFGDARKLLPKIVSANPSKRICVLLDGPKGHQAIALAQQLIRENSNVALIAIHDMRKYEMGKPSKNRFLAKSAFDKIFFTDYEKFYGLYKGLDLACWRHPESGWEPFYKDKLYVGSYGPTLGIIIPSYSDKFRLDLGKVAQMRSKLRQMIIDIIIQMPAFYRVVIRLRGLKK
jgi:hypothetical protein